MSITREDGNLSSSGRVVKEKQYADLDQLFDARTTSDGDIFRKTDAAAVKQALKNLILTNRFEKPYRPSYGGNLSGLLFELADENTGQEVLSRIKNQIDRYEPRAKILDIKVTSRADYNSINVYLEFRVVSTGIIDVLKVTLSSIEDCDPEFNPEPDEQEPRDDFIWLDGPGLEEVFIFADNSGSAGEALLFDDEENLYP